ncbi:hypothetical protein ACTXKN_05665 [Brachybacterium alimentarium]|uniref:hypothetical protein n=1 Tax=Brachybacterium alimentarium TaxID=47845 RepID=UPI003FCF3681
MSTCQSLFHGGAPGLKPGDILLPASKLGPWMNFSYAQGATYYPNHVYLTAEVDSARRYATNYLGPGGHRKPGDVYEVEALGDLLPDPDYPQIGRTKGVFLMTSSAVISKIVARSVEMGEDERWRIDARHAHWALDDGPVYDEEGRLQLSKPMAKQGVPREWLAVIRPWYDGRKLKHDGWPVARSVEEFEAALFDAVPQMDSVHAVQERRLFKRSRPKYVCLECDKSFGADHQEAAMHQIGDVEVLAFSALVGQGPIYPTFLIAAARRRNPERWTWMPTDA